MKFILSLTVVIFFYAEFFSQTGSNGISDARSVGLGKTYTALSNGLYSIGYNPANLSLDTSYSVQFATAFPLPNLNARVGTDFISIKDYNYFFGGVKDENGNTKGRYLTESDKNKLRDIFAEGGEVIGNLFIPDFVLSVYMGEDAGTFGIAMQDYLASRFVFPEQLVNLALDGNQANRLYSFDDADFKLWWLRSYSFSYSRRLPELFDGILKSFSAGLSFKYIQGFAYIGTEYVNSSFSTGSYNEINATGNIKAFASFSDDFKVKYDFDSTKEKEDANFGMFPSSAGSGLGFDIGFNAQLDDIWSFGLSLTDLGSITWDKNVAMYSSNTAMVLRDITDKDEIDSLKDVFTGKGEYTNEITTSLPTALHLGAAFDLDNFLEGNFPGQMLLVADYNQGFNNQPRNSTKPRFSIGAEWKPMDWVPYIRTGFSFGGYDNFGWAFGIGIDASFLQFDFATPDFHYLFMPNQAKRIAFSFGSKWKF